MFLVSFEKKTTNLNISIMDITKVASILLLKKKGRKSNKLEHICSFSFSQGEISLDI